MSLQDADPEIEIHGPIAAFRGEPFKGHDGVREWLETLDETFEVWAIEIDELREHDGVVLVQGAVHAVARGSRIELDFPTTAVVEISDGKVTRLRIFRDHDEALAAVDTG